MVEQKPACQSGLTPEQSGLTPELKERVLEFLDQNPGYIQELYWEALDGMEGAIRLLSLMGGEIGEIWERHGGFAP